VEWEEFLPKLATALDTSVRDSEEIQWRCLKAVMAVQEVDESLRDPPFVVRMRRFGQTLGWFGPFDGGLMARVEETLRQPWFFGDAERAHVEDLLRMQEPGTFLVRASTTVSTAFTITKVSRDRRVNHQRIDYRPGAGYTIKLMTSAGKKLIQERVTLAKFITDLGPHLFLRHPAPRWPYEALFSEQPSNIEGYLVQEDGVDDEDFLASNPASLAELGSSGATMLHQ
jgi:SH2 domain